MDKNKIKIKYVRVGDVCYNKNTGVYINILDILKSKYGREIIVYSPVGNDRVKRWMYSSDLTKRKWFKEPDWIII